jgi:hypothetical protein
VARRGNGTNQRLKAAAAFAALEYPFTYAVWFRDLAFATGTHTLFGGSQPTSGINVENALRLVGNGLGTATNLNLLLDTSAVAFSKNSTGTVSDNNWHHALARAVNAVNRDVVLDGSADNDANNIARPNTTTWEAFAHERHTDDGGWIQHANVDLAYGCIWNVALTNDEIALLSTHKVHPLFVRPDAITNYFPLDGETSPELDLIGRKDLTNTSTTQADTDPSLSGFRVPQTFKGTPAGKHRMFLAF